MDILYFCPPPLLDYSVEQIKDLKQYVDLHVIVSVSLHSPNHSIFRIKESQQINAGVYSFAEIFEKIENSDLFENYFQGCKTVHFVFFAQKFGFNILYTNIKLIRLVKKIDPKIIHFDDISGRLSILILMLRRKNIVLNVHDPKPHSGEQKVTTDLIRKMVYKKVSAFCTFSNFSKLLFEEVYKPTVTIVDLRLVPYQSYALLGIKKCEGIKKELNETVLLFCGRISPYKGIDELLRAFSKLLKKEPKIKLIIAGNGSYKYELPKELIHNEQLILIDRFIDNTEIKSLFEQSDILICPYRDATQSGVLMTADVFKIQAIVSNVGALPEYISNGENGYIYDNKDPMGLENAISNYLNIKDGPRYKSDTCMNVNRNSQLLLGLYRNLANK